MTHIKEKNSSDYNGIESYIFEKWEEEDISWFPIGRALDLKEDESEEDHKGLIHTWKKFLEKHGEENLINHELYPESD